MAGKKERHNPQEKAVYPRGGNLKKKKSKGELTLSHSLKDKRSAAD